MGELEVNLNHQGGGPCRALDVEVVLWWRWNMKYLLANGQRPFKATSSVLTAGRCGRLRSIGRIWAWSWWMDSASSRQVVSRWRGSSTPLPSLRPLARLEMHQQLSAARRRTNLTTQPIHS
jgi:hypothetical protein